MRVVHKDSFASLFLVLVVYIVSGKKAMQVETFIHNVVDSIAMAAIKVSLWFL